MEVDGDVSVSAEDLPRGGDAPDDAVELADGGQRAHPAARVHLDGCQACLDLLPDVVRDLLRLVAAHPAVDPDPVPHGAPEELVDGRTEALPGDVPQGLVDAGDGAGQDRPPR